LLTQWLIAGPTNSERAQGVASPLPDGTTLGAVGVIDQRVTINLVLPDAALKALTDQQVEDINEQFRTTFTPYNFPWIAINARGTLDSGYRLLSDFLPRIEIPRKEPLSPNSPSPANAGNGGNGSLSNKTVFVSAGHGWQWNSFFGTYRTQRPAFPSSPHPPGEGIVEDFNNAEAVNQYLLPYLQNAGQTPGRWRARHEHTNADVDDNSAGFSTQGNWANNGGYNGPYRSAATVNATATQRQRGRSRRPSPRPMRSTCAFPRSRSRAPSTLTSLSFAPVQSRPSPSRRRAMATTGASSATIPSMAANPRMSL
jgi:hypothetical protein